MHLIACAIATLLAASCESPTQASPGIESPRTLTIRPAVASLKIQSSERLSAVVRSGDGMERSILAAWASDLPEVARVDNDGVLTALRLGTILITAAFEDLQASQPVQVVPDYQGRWVGTRRVTGCTRTSGSGPDLCRFVVVNGGAVLPLALTLEHTNSGVTGTLELLDAVMRAPLETGRVSGTFTDGGAVTLSGKLQPALPDHPGETVLTAGDWSTALSDDNRRMVGRFVRRTRFQNAWGWQEVTEQCEVTLERAPQN